MTRREDIQKEIKLLLEKEHFIAKEIVDFISERELYDDCMQIALSNDEPAAWRATWILSHCMKTSKTWLYPHLESMVQVIPEIKKDGHIRELLKFFRDVPYESYPEKKTGELFDFCLRKLNDNKTQPGTRSNALQVLLKITEKNPDLFSEVQASFELIKNHLSSGVRKSCETRVYKLENKILNKDKI